MPAAAVVPGIATNAMIITCLRQPDEKSPEVHNGTAEQAPHPLPAPQMAERERQIPDRQNPLIRYRQVPDFHLRMEGFPSMDRSGVKTCQGSFIMDKVE